MATLTRVAIDLCRPCLQSKGSRMCETPDCGLFHEVLPSTFVSRIQAQSVPVSMDLLIELADYFDDRADVLDGDYGAPRPNRAMQLNTSVQGAIESFEARGKGYDWWNLAKEIVRRHE
jgi:hypothetical protein